MLYRLQDITRASYQLDLGDSDAAREASLHETATRLGREFTLAIRGALAEAHKVIRDVSLPRLWLESELVRISQMATAPEPRREAAPPAEPTRPRRETRPTEAPAPTPPAAVEAPKPAPTVAEAPGMDGELAAVWAQVIASLPSGDKVPPITRRMRPAQLVAVDGNTLTIELARQTDIDWMHENPARIGHIRERGPAEPETVELPAEGDRLEQLARQVFEQN
jgi:DNA polymerase-3 subunit gamma/tau